MSISGLDISYWMDNACLNERRKGQECSGVRKTWGGRGVTGLDKGDNKSEGQDDDL